jgi:predicted DNA-binding protein
MDDEQYQRLETQLANAGATMEDAIADFFDDMDDSFVAEQRLAAVHSGTERIIPWAEVRASNGL